jgi:hypothetical protein
MYNINETKVKILQSFIIMMKATEKDTTTCTVAGAAEMNSLAVLQFLQGEPHAALNTLKKTLAVLKWQIVTKPSRGDNTSKQRFICRAVTEIDSSQECPFMHQCGSLFPFYASPFQLLQAEDDDRKSLPNKVDHDDDDDDDGTLPFMVVMYNLALVQHAIALDCHRNREITKAALYFQRALQMYECAFRLHREQASSSSSSSSSSSAAACTYAEHQLLLLLATCNNMAFVYSHDCNFGAINDCLELLLDLMMFCDDESFIGEEEEDAILSVNGKAYNFFFSTTIMLEGRLVTLSPAA